MTDLTKLTLAEARDGLKAKSFSATELTTAFLQSIEASNAALNAYVLPTPEHALAQAKASDERIAKGEARPLEGLPLGIKDLFCTKGIRTTACSNILDDFKPAYELTVDAEPVGRRRGHARQAQQRRVRDGLVERDERVRPGRQSMAAQRHGARPTSSCRADRRAARRRRSPPTCAWRATATDTGGSIRQPAALTGTVGIKPTYGRCSRWGIVAFASSLDQAGPIAKTVRDAAILLRHMASHDPKDSTSVDAAGSRLRGGDRTSVKGLRIGVPKEYRVDGMSQEIDALWAKGIAVAEGCRRDDPRHLAAAHQVRAAGLLHRGAGGSIVQPRALRRRALRAARTGQGPDRHLREHARARLRQGGQAARSDRHLRAVGRLLRRLLPQGAEGAHAHQARLRRSVGHGRRRC